MQSMVRCTNQESSPFKYCSNFRIPIADTEICDPISMTCDENHPQYNDIISAHQAVYTPNEIKIPTFQRGIQWDINILLDCVYSNSPVVGTAIFGRTNQMPQTSWLLDGLQRFSAFTALIILLENLLFTKQSENNANPWNAHPTLLSDILHLQNMVAINFSALPVVKYNNLALLNHRRAIIKSSYNEFILNTKQHVEKLVDTTKNGYDLDGSKYFIQKLSNFFQKPLFIQEFTHFSTMDELIATFIAINTVRVELSPADVCRSVLVESIINKGANPLQGTEIENLFNQTLLQENGCPKKKFSPLIKVLESDWLNDKSNVIVNTIFDQASSVQAVEKEFTEFCQWIEYFNSIDDGYLNLIYDLGDNPYIATMMYYYHKNKDNLSTRLYSIQKDELHKIAIAYIRKLLDGTVGDTLPITKEVSINYNVTFDNFINKITPQRSGSINSPPDRSWLLTSLFNVRNKDTAKLIFNACVLPSIREGEEYGTNFSKMNFRGNGQNNWTIDHMIPENAFLVPPNTSSVGGPYKESLRNYCPIIGSDNSSYKRSNLSIKISNPIYYRSYVDGSDPRKLVNGDGHPYIVKLIEEQGNIENPISLDNRDYLATEINNICLGEQRINILCDILMRKV